MKWVLVNYNFDPSWILDYTDDYLIYDRSDDGNDWTAHLPQDKIIKTKNLGNVDYDKLSYLVDNYENLPDVFLWGKTNLFKYIPEKDFNELKDNKVFTPLLSNHHVTYSDHFGIVCYYENGMYYERNDSWYFGLMHRYPNYNAFAQAFELPKPDYIPFAPGGNYILTREVVHRYPKSMYDKMRNILPFCPNPAEAHACERSYYTLWR